MENLKLRQSAEFVSQLNSEPLIIAEVGVENGTNALAMLKNLNVKRLYLIDPYEKYQDVSVSFSKERMDKVYFAMFKRLESFFDKVVLIMKSSIFASALFPDEFFDYVYIDANHRYEEVSKDIKSWFPKIKIGGILGGHDHAVSQCEVKKAVDEFIKQQKINLSEGRNDWWIKK